MLQRHWKWRKPKMGLMKVMCPKAEWNGKDVTGNTHSRAELWDLPALAHPRLYCFFGCYGFSWPLVVVSASNGQSPYSRRHYSFYACVSGSELFWFYWFFSGIDVFFRDPSLFGVESGQNTSYCKDSTFYVHARTKAKLFPGLMGFVLLFGVFPIKGHNIIFKSFCTTDDFFSTAYF